MEPQLLPWLNKHGSQTVLALVSAILLTMAYPKLDFGWLAWVALVPLVLAIRQVRPKSGFVLGFSFGMVHQVCLVYWTVHTMNQYGNIPMVQAVPLLILLAAYLSIYPGLFAALLTWLRPTPGRLILIAPALWVSLEMVRGCLFTGFPWELLGYSQYTHLRLIQVADTFGVYGLSGLIVFANAVLAVAILCWLELDWQDLVPEISGNRLKVLINARVEMNADQLRSLFRNVIREVTKREAATFREVRVENFHPNFPKPTHRYV